MGHAEQSLDEMLSSEEKDLLVDLVRAQREGRISRRGLLAMLGGAGVGAGAVLAGTDRAAGDPSTSDSYGNVGLPNDRVDVFADGIDLETTLEGNGTVKTDVNNQSVSTDDLDINTADFVSTGDFVGVGPSSVSDIGTTVTSGSYVDIGYELPVVWDNLPTDSQGAIRTVIRNGSTGTASYRLRNNIDGETVFEETGVDTSAENINRVDNYTPTTTSSIIRLQLQVKSDDGNNVRTDDLSREVGVQL